MKKLVLSLIVTVCASSALATPSPKLRVSCSDAPRGNNVFYVDLVQYSEGKLVLEVLNKSSSRQNARSVLPYDKCVIQVVQQNLQMQ